MLRLVAVVSLVSLGADAARAGARQRATVLMPENPEARRLQEEWGFADAVAVEGTVYLSGVVVNLRPGDSGLEEAYTRSFEQIAAVLRRAGVSWDDVVEMTSYHTDLVSQMPAMRAVKDRYVRAPFPAWTAVGVTRLIPPNGITEIRIIARAPR